MEVKGLFYAAKAYSEEVNGTLSEIGADFSARVFALTPETPGFAWQKGDKLTQGTEILTGLFNEFSEVKWSLVYALSNLGVKCKIDMEEGSSRLPWAAVSPPKMGCTVNRGLIHRGRVAFREHSGVSWRIITRREIHDLIEKEEERRDLRMSMALVSVIAEVNANLLNWGVNESILRLQHFPSAANPFRVLWYSSLLDMKMEYADLSSYLISSRGIFPRGEGVVNMSRVKFLTDMGIDVDVVGDFAFRQFSEVEVWAENAIVSTPVFKEDGEVIPASLRVYPFINEEVVKEAMAK